jgi:hypothetical protein
MCDLSTTAVSYYAHEEPAAGFSKESEVDSACLGSRQNLARAKHANATRPSWCSRRRQKRAMCRCGCVWQAHSNVLKLLLKRILLGYAGFRHPRNILGGFWAGWGGQSGRMSLNTAATRHSRRGKSPKMCEWDIGSAKSMRANRKAIRIDLLDLSRH